MEKIKPDVQYNRTASVSGDIVTFKHVSRLVDGDHYMTTKIDLGNMDGDDVKRHCATNVLIQIIRPRALKPFKSTEIDENAVLDPTDYPATRGGGIDKREAGIRTLVDTIGLPRELAERVYDQPTGAHKIVSEFLAKTNK